MRILIRSFLLVAAFSLVSFAFVACDKNKSKPTNTANGSVPSSNSTNPAVVEKKPPTMTDYPVGDAQTPSEAYRMLFAAVKSQDPAKIKLMLSKDTVEGLAAFAAGMQKKTVEQVIENGFTDTTFADEIPQMRDERIKGDFAAVEVWSSKSNKWQDIPLIRQNGTWKVAFGEQWNSKWKSPGKGQAIIEQENANAENPNSMIKLSPVNGNANFQSAPRPKKKE